MFLPTTIIIEILNNQNIHARRCLKQDLDCSRNNCYYGELGTLLSLWVGKRNPCAVQYMEINTVLGTFNFKMSKSIKGKSYEIIQCIMLNGNLNSVCSSLMMNFFPAL